MRQDSLLSAAALRCCVWSERWFPDAFAFALLAVAVVAVGAAGIGAAPLAVAQNFGSGFWSLIPFTMQMSFIIIGGYVAADSPPVAKLVQRLAAVPRSGRAAVTLVALSSVLLSLVHWGLSMVFASLLARAVARRSDLRVDYRAAGAAACAGVGSVWALGLSSSAAQQLGIDLAQNPHELPERTRPGEWLDYSPLPTLFIAALGLGWLGREFSTRGAVAAISSLNTYNLIFVLAGLLLQWRPRRFIESVARSVPSVAGVLITNRAKRGARSFNLSACSFDG